MNSRVCEAVSVSSGACEAGDGVGSRDQEKKSEREKKKKPAKKE